MPLPHSHRNLKINVELTRGTFHFKDENGNDADEKLVRIGDDVKWCTRSTGKIDFEFPYGHPFLQDPLPFYGPGCGQPVTVTSTNPPVSKYNVIFTDPKGKDYRIDPKIIIDSGLRARTKKTRGIAGVLAVAALVVIVAAAAVVLLSDEKEMI